MCIYEKEKEKDDDCDRVK